MRWYLFYMTTPQEAKLNIASALEFLLAGNATFTLRSQKTEIRYTFKVQKSEDRPGTWFVKYLTGSNNESDYRYLGVISNRKFRLTSKSTLRSSSTPVIAFDWFFNRIISGVTPLNVEIWHAGRCGRCGRTLTVPESVEAGFGPECVTKLAA